MKLESLGALLLVAWGASGCEGEQGPARVEAAPVAVRAAEQKVEREVRSTTKVLILSSSVTGGTTSREYVAASTYRSTWTINVVTPTQWKAMTADQFMAYRAIIIGDPQTCTGNESPFQAAIENKDTWGAVIDGRVSIFSTNPVSNSTAQVVQNGIRFVMDTPAPYTGIYVSLGCAYQSAPADTQVSLLDELGTFKVEGVPTCGASGHFFTMSSATLNSGISDTNLPGSGGCVAKSVFTSYPDHTYSFATLAVTSATKPVPGAQVIVDYLPTPETTYVGTPYWLVRGASNSDSGCGQDGVPSFEECDLGDGINGLPATTGQDPLSTCSWSCHLNWCGDGHVDPEFGEECDLGSKNGRVNDGDGNLSTCNGFCKLVNIPTANLPPAMVCRDVTVQVTSTCGVMADINNGSSDPEGQPMTCVQSPPGPYNLGAGASSSTVVALTCTDSANNSASCTGTVTVVDKVAPEVTLKPQPDPDQSLECGGTYTDPGATATDLCSGPLPASAIAVSGSVNMGVPGAYSLSYTATDPANNVSAPKTRNVVVSDTQAPALSIGLANVGQECGLPFTDPGYSAADACLGDVTSRVVRTGSVDTATLGNYVLKYNVADTVGNAAPEQSRVVTVADTLKPVVNMNPPASLTAECGQPNFLDPGATASDACAGALTATAVNPPNIGATGTYNVQYHAFDPTGNEGFSSGTRTVEVKDTLAPVVALNGSASMGLECAATFNDPGATASDQCVGPLSVTVSGTVDNKQLNTPQTLVYSANDGKGHVGSASRSVTVTDTLKPTVTLNGGLTQTVECGDPTYADPGATASDACAGPLTAVATTSANPGAPGSYTINYEATDPSGNKGTSAAGRQVTVSDTLPPALVLNGNAVMPLECATPFNDPGATASDQCAGNLSGAIVKTGSVNNMQPAAYQLTYSVSDGQGHSDSKDRTVNVSDTLKPAITVLGPLDTTYECGSTYVDPGATGNDACAGPLPVNTVQTSNPNQPGEIIVSYWAQDPSGNREDSAVTRTVHVNDTQPPTLVLNGSLSMGLECADPYNDPGATANDACFGDVTNRITKTGSVNNLQPNIYTLTYSVTDPSGQAATPVQRTVTVSDTRAPTITVLGSLNEVVSCDNGPYADPGATATDTCAGDLTAAIQTIGSVNPGAAGSYTLTYKVKDPSDNTTTSSDVRSVQVVDDLPPELTLLGSANPSIECGTAFNDPGATASDACAGDLTAAIVKTGNVSTGTPGSYQLDYSVTDPSNHSVSNMRTVAVADTQAPTLALIGANPLNVECAPTYVDPGATATDLCEGNLDSRVSHNTVDSTQPGDYTVTYTASDLTGNTATPLDRTVAVRDTKKPVITVNGPLETSYECGSGPYEDPGATASDACAGPLTAVATTSADPSAPGSYTITYEATDPSGNKGTASISVTVVDTQPPSIVCPEPIVVEIAEGDGATVKPGAAQATDACDPVVEIVSPEERRYPLGNSPVTYTARDAAGHTTSCTATITVVEVSLPDTRIVSGPPDETLETGAVFEFGASKPNVTYECSLDGSAFRECPVDLTLTELAEGQHTLQVRARDSSGNVDPTPASATWLVLPPVAEDLDRALLGGGRGCSSTGSAGPSSLGMMGLGVLALLLTRKRARASLPVFAVLLLGTEVSAQPQRVPTFELELLKLNPSGTGSLLLGSGELLPDGDYRFSLTTHYEHDPLVFFQNGTRLGVVVQHRVTAHLAASYGLWNWLELGAQVPVLLFQRGDDLTAQEIGQPEGGPAPGTPLLTVRLKLLAERDDDPVDVSLGVHAGPAVGRGGALARELRATPSVMAGRRFGSLRAAVDAGILLRPRTVLSPDSNIQDEIGHSLRLGAMLATTGEGLRGELTVAASVPLKREGSSLETLVGARLPVSGSLEVYGLAGLGFGSAPGTPDFRLLLGMAYGRAHPPRVEAVKPRPEVSPEDSNGDAAQDSDSIPAKDSDGDGVLDEEDACPTEPGVPEMHGCPARDIDNDTVQDHLDNCPEVPGPADNQGCPVAEKQLVAIQKDRIEIKETVYFDFDKASIQSRSFPLLDQVARVLTEHPEILSVTIEGHTDDRGSAEYNRDLSQRRAEAVRDYLAQRGVARERMESQGFGEDRPVQSNATDEGRAANRRVEFITRYTQGGP